MPIFGGSRAEQSQISLMSLRPSPVLIFARAVNQIFNYYNARVERFSLFQFLSGSAFHFQLTKNLAPDLIGEPSNVEYGREFVAKRSVRTNSSHGGRIERARVHSEIVSICRGYFIALRQWNIELSSERSICSSNETAYVPLSPLLTFRLSRTLANCERKGLPKSWFEMKTELTTPLFACEVF